MTSPRLFEPTPPAPLRLDGSCPIVVSCGVGVDSVAMLVAMRDRDIRPDKILFADVGNEWPETYAYLAILGRWLAKVDFPAIEIVRNPRPKSGDASLADACLRTRVLPALSYGRHQCSLVWKIDPQERAVRRTYGWSSKRGCWGSAEYVIRAIGYDAGPRDSCRAGKAASVETPGFRNWYPLIEWGLDREACKAVITAAGLPIPRKSSCYMCPAMKKHEVDDLAATHPQLARTALMIEACARDRGLGSVVGLGRHWSWITYLAAAPLEVRAGLGFADCVDPLEWQRRLVAAASARRPPTASAVAPDPQLTLFAA